MIQPLRYRAFVQRKLMLACLAGVVVAGCSDNVSGSDAPEVVAETVKVREVVTEYRTVEPTAPDEAAAVASEAAEVTSERQRLNKVKSNLNDRKYEVAERERSLDDREADLDEREDKLAQQELAVQQQPPDDTSQQSATQSVYYENCTAARDAGDTPLYRGDPGYASHLDRDNDGIACE